MSELKQLIDYTSMYLAKEDNPEVIQEQLHNFLLRCLSIGFALNETQAVRQNEDAESNFYCLRKSQDYRDTVCKEQCRICKPPKKIA